ncbi:MAG: hypothetical protein JRG91_18295 [Deltaproteobacteria bacterium]|nr:hypothetical protein [Deltaproteobacteria bacterium]
MKGCMLLVAAVSAALLFTNAVQAQEAVGTETTEPAAVEPTDGTVAPVAAVQPAPAVEEPPRSTGRGLIIGGWITFGVLYVPGLIAGISSIVKYPGAYGALYFIPGIGPIVVGALTISWGGIADDLSGNTGVVSSAAKIAGGILISWGILQLGAMAMIVAGHLMYSRYKATLGEITIPNTKIAFRLTPIATRETMGLGVTGYF